MVDYDTLVRGTLEMGKAEMAREEQLDAIDDEAFESCLERLRRSANTAESEPSFRASPCIRTIRPELFAARVCTLMGVCGWAVR